MGLEVVELDGFHPSDSDTSEIAMPFASKRSYDIRLESKHNDCQRCVNSNVTL